MEIELGPKNYSNIIEKNYSNFVNTNVHKIVEFASQKSSIYSVLAIGSLAKRAMRNYSNVNIVFIIQDKDASLFQNFKNIFSDTLAFSVENTKKMIFYLNYSANVEQRVIEVEILFENSLNNLRDIIIGSSLEKADIPNIILFNRDESLLQELEKLIQENIDYKKDLPKIINKLSNEFIENFAKACFNIRKTELYQFYFTLSNCYTIIAKLDAIRHENFENLNQPVYALARLDLRKEFPFYRLNLPNISLVDKDLRLEYLYQFNYIMKKLNQKYAIGYSEAIEQFLKKLDQEVYFWNLRDISYLDQNHLKEGLLYRSSTLSRYSERQELKKFFYDQHINTIIDLRSIEEVDSNSYSNIEINYVNIPISEKENMDINQLKYVSPESFDIFYEMFLRYNQEEIKQIFETLATKEGAFVIHCHAGRDRTGLVVALLLEILGEKSTIISESLIAEDYLNSGNSTDRNVFNIYIKTLKEFGGAKNYLQSENGLRTETIQKIVEKFTK